jgi:TRAP-type uncharacterized transport system fused permease subunit
MLCFGLFGPYLRDLFAHRGFSLERLATALFITTNGVFWGSWSACSRPT